MLSCQQGNVTISKLLLEWEPETITLTNFGGVTPVQCALQRGHTSMVTKLENWCVKYYIVMHVILFEISCNLKHTSVISTYICTCCFVQNFRPAE